MSTNVTTPTAPVTPTFLDIPVPEITRTSKFRFLDEMEVGKCAALPLEEADSLRVAVGSRKKKSGKEYVTRTITDNNVQKIAVWRMK